MSNPYPEASWGKKVVDQIINLSERGGSLMKDIKKDLIENKSDARLIEAAVKKAVKEGVLIKNKTKPLKYKLVSDVHAKSVNPLTPLTPQEILITSTFIDGSFAWIGNVFSTHGDNFMFYFVFATDKGCFLVCHASNQRFQCDGTGGSIIIPDDPGFSDPDCGQPFQDEATGLQPKWLSDQLKPYKLKVLSDPVAFIKAKLEEKTSFRGNVQLFGRQPLREIFQPLWGWGLKWENLLMLPKTAFSTISDRFLLNILICLDFDEQSMVYNVNGLLSREILDDKMGDLMAIAFGHNAMTASDFPGYKTRSNKESQKLIKKAEKDASDTWYSFVETFQHKD